MLPLKKKCGWEVRSSGGVFPLSDADLVMYGLCKSARLAERSGGVLST